MFKRIASLLFVLILLIPVQVFAVDEVQEESIIYLEDGSYIIVTTEEFASRSSGSKTAQRTYTYTASNGVVCWDATLTASFSYTGSSATCTSSDCSITVYKSNWYTVSESATKSGNTATATFTMGRKVLGITVDKDTYTISISCDPNGNLS